MSSESKITIGIIDDNDQPVRLDTAKIFGSRLLIQGDSGSGKSVMVRRIAEQTAGVLPWFIIDPEGEYSTLRETADVLVLGGDYGDATLDVSTAGAYAHELRSAGVNVVLDLSEMDGTTEQRQWVRAFLDGLVAVKSGPKALVLVDECHEFAPENGKGESCATESVARLMKRGRKRGLAGVVVTQRLSSLSKEVGSLCTNVLIGTTAPLDAARAAELMGLPARDKHKFTRLGTHCWMGRGQAISVEPVQFQTEFPTTREPDPETADAKPATSASLSKLAKALGKIKPPADDPGEDAEELKATINELRSEMAKVLAEQVEAIDEAEVQRRVDEVASILREHFESRLCELPPMVSVWLEKAMQAASAEARAQLDAWMNGFELPEQTTNLAASRLAALATRVGTTPCTAPATSATQLQYTSREPAESAEPTDGVNRPKQKILDALAWYKSVGINSADRSIVATIAGVSPRSSGYEKNLSTLRTMALIDYPGQGRVALTDAGQQAANTPASPPTLRELHQRWLGSKALSRPQALLLEILLDLASKAIEKISRDELATRAGVSMRSSGFEKNVSRLSSLGLVQYPQPGAVALTELLFPEGLR